LSFWAVALQANQLTRQALLYRYRFTGKTKRFQAQGVIATGSMLFVKYRLVLTLTDVHKGLS
jgi:hypothetical protein